MTAFTFDSCLQIIQDTFLIKDVRRVLVRRDAESHSRADFVEAKAKVLADQDPGLEAWVKELETELESSRDSITKLEEQVGDRQNMFPS